jgi:hypothetical protein
LPYLQDWCGCRQNRLHTQNACGLLLCCVNAQDNQYLVGARVLRIATISPPGYQTVDFRHGHGCSIQAMYAGHLGGAAFGQVKIPSLHAASDHARIYRPRLTFTT